MSGSYGSEGIMKIIEHQGNGINYYTLVNNQSYERHYYGLGRHSHRDQNP
ncbi:Aldose 1-epimerase [Lactiplantibacillus plantarum subsp. plantarum]|uniref:Aldose 1-epimerase n=1 Tax=Lactiplantibacillus plantarum subsp. plantarum TaxID=337330 RepID=A0A2S3U0M3_LACPN|nr:Aldose 1-epimerase [Lactiplantibacillus plantarum subsp. plantarum]